MYGRDLALGGQPQGHSSSEDGLITFRPAAGYVPPPMVTNEDGLLVENPMHKAFKARQAAIEAANGEEADQALTDSISQGVAQKKAKDAAESQAWAERRAVWDQQTDAEFQALASQRSAPRNQKRGDYLRINRGGRGPGR
jgi:hypothetical protein